MFITTQVVDAVEAKAERVSVEEFESFYNSISNEVEFNPMWKNGTGYLDYAVHAEINGIAKAIDDRSRRVILVNTQLGNFVLFERYTPNHGPFVLVSNTPRGLRKQGFHIAGTSVQDFRALRDGVLSDLLSKHAVESDEFQTEYCKRVWDINLDEIIERYV